VTADLDLAALVRTVPDFPKPGVRFRDITTLLKHADGFRATIERLVAAHRHLAIDKVAGIESRGFIIGAAVASALRTGFVPIRKRGKLPAENFGQDYQLEYGADRLEMHRDASRAASACSSSTISSRPAERRRPRSRWSGWPAA
jgi:adenine phosphoribosyltransferase